MPEVTPDRVADVLGWISRGATAAGAYVPGPWGIATAVVGALAGVASDVIHDGEHPGPIDRVADPGPLLEAMRARVRARAAKGGGGT